MTELSHSFLTQLLARQSLQQQLFLPNPSRPLTHLHLQQPFAAKVLSASVSSHLHETPRHHSHPVQRFLWLACSKVSSPDAPSNCRLLQKTDEFDLISINHHGTIASVISTFPRLFAGKHDPQRSPPLHPPLPLAAPTGPVFARCHLFSPCVSDSHIYAAGNFLQASQA